MKITHTSLTAAKESINCGALNDISGFLKKISKSLWTNLLSLSTEGIDVDKSEQGKNGIFYLRATTKRGNKFAVNAVQFPVNLVTMIYSSLLTKEWLLR